MKIIAGKRGKSLFLSWRKTKIGVVVKYCFFGLLMLQDRSEKIMTNASVLFLSFCAKNEKILTKVLNFLKI
jgi:hypothetical protein